MDVQRADLQGGPADARGRPDPGRPPPVSVPSAKLAEWQALYGPQITRAADPPYKDWLERNGRVLLDEHDSAFHTAMGYRPHVDETGTDRDIGFHPLRLDPDDFE
jgi:hypothetical protein